MRAGPEALGRALAAAPDPEQARVALSRVGESPVAREALEQAIEPAVMLLGLAHGAADFLVSHPEEASLFADLAARSRDALLVEARDEAHRHGPAAGLRRFRRRALYRVAARDLLEAPFEEVVAEVTALAEACLEVAVEEAGSGLAVLGMGKLGGAELNYASDVDVIFVHVDGDSQEEAAGRASRVIALLAEPTPEGMALRVDTNLRPEGRAGPLSRSLASTREYYRSHAATWERQALLKARPVAGDLELGSALLADLAPVVYPENLETRAIDDIREMKVRIEDYVRARGKERVEVKRGRGGIRDVEFAVQLLQMVHGRREPALREPNTLRALAALAAEGYVATADADTLAGSYRFLRTLEHRLQLMREAQTHELPADEPSLRRVARSMGLADPEAIRREHSRNADIVRGLHERLFYRPLLEAFAGSRMPRPGRDRPATEELLAGLGFADPVAAYEHLERGLDPGTRTGKVLGAGFPVLAPALSLAPEPDSALVRLLRVAEALAPPEVERLAADTELLRRLGVCAGASAWMTDVLAAHPGWLERLSGGAAPAAEPQEALLEIAAASAVGDVRVPEVGKRLARVADDAIRTSLDAAAPPVPLAVIGLGSLGGEELGFASDLDVVFVFEGEGSDAFEEAERAAESVLAGIRTAGFDADPDLRPEGRSGSLARSLGAYIEYWQRWGQTWEFQALIKARHIAGDDALGRRFLSNASDFAYPEALSLERIAEIRRMRVRMEEERVRPPDARRFHLKLGYGGLADVQFAVELQQMRHGREHPEVRRRHTLEALEVLAAARFVEDSVALALGEAYVLLNEVRNAMELDRRVSAEALPPTPEGQLALARRLGYEEASRRRFLEDYRRVTRRARRAMERVFYDDPG